MSNAKNLAEFGLNVGDAGGLTLQSDGDVGIGVASPSARLDVREEKTGGGVLVQVYNEDNSDTTTQTAGIALGPDTRGGTARITAVKENASFATNAGRDVALTFSSVLNNTPTEGMRIDSSGNLLVGTLTTLTSAGLSAGETGIVLRSGNLLIASREDGAAILVNRKTSNGDFIEFRKDGSTVGSIGSEGGDALYVGTGDTGLKFSAADIIQPFNPSTVAVRDGGIDLGNSGARFKDIYLSGGAYVGGTGSANYLDDYEEGTFTPSFTTSGTLTVNSATYTKIGRQVTCRFYLSASTTCSGDITGLPFTPNGESAGVVGYQTHISGETMGILVQAANVWNLRIGQTQYGLAAGKQIRGMFTYFTDA